MKTVLLATVSSLNSEGYAVTGQCAVVSSSPGSSRVMPFHLALDAGMFHAIGSAMGGPNQPNLRITIEAVDNQERPVEGLKKYPPR